MTTLAVIALAPVSAKISHPSLLFTPKAVAAAKDRVKGLTVNGKKHQISKEGSLLNINTRQ